MRTRVSNKFMILPNKMSAAPLITSSPLAQDEFASNHVKKARRETSYLPTEYLTCPSAGVSDINIALLQNEYPHLSNPFLSSILESTGGKIEAARAVVSQIVQVGIKHRAPQNDNRGKRSRPILDQVEWDSDSSSHTSHHHQELHDSYIGRPQNSLAKSSKAHETDGTSSSTITVDGAVNELLKSLQGVATVEQARDRLKPVIEHMLHIVRNGISCDTPTTLNKKTQKLLTRTIIHQSEALSAASHKMDKNLRINDELLSKIQALEQSKSQLECDVKRLKNANSKLSYFIAATVGQNGCDANRWRSHQDENHEGDGGGFQGWGFNQSSFRSPDVF